MRNKASRAIFDYWINIKGDRTAPTRSEIDPAALRHLLPHLFIAAIDVRGVVTFRLAGTRICELFDREFRDAPFALAWVENQHSYPVEILRDVVRSERPALLDVSVLGGEMATPSEMLLLPVRPTATDACDRVLGALLPKASRSFAAQPAADGLALENWRLLTDEGAYCDIPSGGDRPTIPDVLRRLLPGRLSNPDRLS